jgi:hypothetical protein
VTFKDSGCGQDDAESGLGGFFKSLLSGIPWSESSIREGSTTLGVPSAGIVSVHNSNGRTRVVGEDRDDIVLFTRKHARAETEAAAEQLLDDIRIDTDRTGGLLDVEVVIPRKWNRHGSVDLEIRLPREIEVRASSSNGKLCLMGMRCGVRAHSSNGSVRIEDVVGDIEITTANAKVSCDCTCGRLVARSSNGKIELGEHSGSIDASTSNGLIHASIDKLSREGVNLATSNGRIVLELPDDPNAEIDIRVDNGVIRNELDLGSAGEESNGRLRGRLGHGGCPIKLRTSNGTISLR